MAESAPSGFIREVELQSGTAYYAQIRLAGGKRLQRKLGLAWKKRSRAPAGYLTRSQAEARLREILEGRDASVPIAPRQGDDVRFEMAAAE